jgi:hypothetical protein
MSTINSVNLASYTPPVTTPSTANSPSNTADPAQLQDIVQLSLAGRIALGVNDGKLTSSQGQQLDSELGSLSETASAQFGQVASQLSEAIYGDTHNGASIPAGLTVAPAEGREFIQAGRVATQENAGNLTSAQGSQFLTQITQIYQQSQSGTSASATTQAQNQLSAEIYQAAHSNNETTT